MALKLLVIEGDQGVLKVMEQVLEKESHEVIIAKDSTVLADLDEIKPDLIILDEWLERESGIELCRKLKANPKTGVIPVVLLSAMISIEYMSAMAGANSYIRKPFDRHELAEVINRYQEI